MSNRKHKSSAADDLIESLMDDLKDLPEEGSIKFPSEVSISPASAQKKALSEATNIWASLEEEIDHSEFGASSDYESYQGPEASEENLYENFSAEESEFDKLDLPSVGEDSVYQGPSADGGYQNSAEIDEVPEVKTTQQPSSIESAVENTFPNPSGRESAGRSSEEKTVSIQQDFNLTSSVVSGTSSGSDAEKTLAVDGFANARLGARRKPEVDVKVSVGHFRGARSGNVMTSVDASLAQAENLKLAQQRILELENEVEQLRAENEELASAGEIVRIRGDELAVRISSIEKEKNEIEESAQSEILILKGNLQFKESEAAKARFKIEELETRLKSDFKKIRVRERELENRLELLKAEKSALVRSKDEYILEQKRKIDRLSQELDNYRKKCLELNKALEANQDQFKRTERALRLALTNLEAKEESLPHLKKAE